MKSETHCYTYVLRSLRCPNRCLPRFHTNSLPYGTIGFISHILTYYTIVMLSAGRSPLMPWRKLSSPRMDMFLGVVGLLVGTLITALTIYRCRQRWQFLLIAVWKATLSVSLGALGVSAARETKRIEELKERLRPTEQLLPKEDDDDLDLKPRYRPILWWMLLYVLGIFVGLTGLISLVKHSWGEPIIVLSSKIFGGIAIGLGGLAGIVPMILYYIDKADREERGRARRGLKFLGGGALVVFLVLLLTSGFLAALYSDWVLAGLAGSLIGVPSKDNSVLYYGYFGAKRLPFFSI